MNQKSMQVALKKILPVDLAEEVNQRVIARIKKIDREREKYPQKALEKHFGENILPILVLYLVLKEDHSSPQNVLELTRKVTDEMYSIGRKRMAFLGRFSFFYRLIQKLTPQMMKSAFPKEGWDIEWLEVSSKRVAFNMHACFYLDSLTKYGAPELTPVFCGLDDLIYDGVSPHLRWQRTMTLGRGDAYCDFRFINPQEE